MKAHEPHHLAVEHEKPDQWHRHVAVEGTPQTEHTAVASPKVLAISFITISTTVAVSVLILVVFFDHYTTNYKAEQMENTTQSASFIKYKGDWEDVDSRTYAWADPKEGTIRIPLDKAMDRVVEKYKSKPGAGSSK